MHVECKSENVLKQPVHSTCGVDSRRLITRTGRIRSRYHYTVNNIIIVSNPVRLLIPHDRLQRVWATKNTYDFYYYSVPIVPVAEGTFWNFLGIFFEMKDSEVEVKKKISHTCKETRI